MIDGSCCELGLHFFFGHNHAAMVAGSPETDGRFFFLVRFDQVVFFVTSASGRAPIAKTDAPLSLDHIEFGE